MNKINRFSPATAPVRNLRRGMYAVCLLVSMLSMALIFGFALAYILS